MFELSVLVAQLGFGVWTPDMKSFQMLLAVQAACVLSQGAVRPHIKDTA